MADPSSNLTTRSSHQNSTDESPPSSSYRRKAVALRYRSGDDPAPVVIAKGSGSVADRIMEIAQKHNIPLYSDPDLVAVLSQLDLGQLIPPELYQAIAEVLAFVYRVNRKYAEIAKKSG